MTEITEASLTERLSSTVLRKLADRQTTALEIWTAVESALVESPNLNRKQIMELVDRGLSDRGLMESVVMPVVNRGREIKFPAEATECVPAAPAARRRGDESLEWQPDPPRMLRREPTEREDYSASIVRAHRASTPKPRNSLKQILIVVFITATVGAILLLGLSLAGVFSK